MAACGTPDYWQKHKLTVMKPNMIKKDGHYIPTVIYPNLHHNQIFLCQIFSLRSLGKLKYRIGPSANYHPKNQNKYPQGKKAYQIKNL